LAAVAQNGAALKFADKSLKRDREFALAAVARNRRALWRVALWASYSTSASSRRPPAAR